MFWRRKEAYVAAKKKPESPEEKEARRAAEARNYEVTEIFKVCDPDCDGERETLFKGRYRGDKRAKIPGDEDQELYRLVVRGDDTGYVISGW